jgi:hypothetical protein
MVEPEQGAAKIGSVVNSVPGDAKERTSIEAPEIDPRSADRHSPAIVKGGHRASEHRSGLQRTASAIRTMVPLVQKMLPLLEGNVVSAAANLLAPKLMTPTIDLAPLEASLTTLRGEIASMEVRNAGHDRALKRIDAQLETMKDTLERSADEQEHTVDELSRIRKRVALFSAIGVVLLLVSIGVNAALFWYVKGLVH